MAQWVSKPTTPGLWFVIVKGPMGIPAMTMMNVTGNPPGDYLASDLNGVKMYRPDDPILCGPWTVVPIPDMPGYASILPTTPPPTLSTTLAPIQ